VIQEPVALRLGQQDAVGHQLDEPLGATAILEAQLVAHQLTQRHLQLLGDARGHRARGDAARLRMPDHASDASPGFEADLRQLRGLSRAGLAGQDHDRMCLDGAADFLAML